MFINGENLSKNEIIFQNVFKASSSLKYLSFISSSSFSVSPDLLLDTAQCDNQPGTRRPAGSGALGGAGRRDQRGGEEEVEEGGWRGTEV